MNMYIVTSYYSLPLSFLAFILMSSLVSKQCSYSVTAIKLFYTAVYQKRLIFIYFSQT